MHCRKCGIKVENNSTFCPECGERMPENEGAVTVNENKNTPSETSPSSPPFREEFYRHIKSFIFFMTVLFATVYYPVGVLNTIRHFSSSDIFISVTGLLYGLVAMGLIVPAVWMVYLDRSPHIAFVPIKLYAFINILKLFLFTAFGVLAVLGAIMGKDEISKNILYIADESLSVYILTLVSQTAKNPSMMLVSTSFVIVIIYIVTGLMYHISLIRFFNSVSKRIHDNNTAPVGYNVISSLSFVVSVISLMHALSMYLYLKDDIYNVLFAVFKGLFHLMVFFDIRSFAKLFAEELDDEEEITEISE